MKDQIVSHAPLTGLTVEAARRAAAARLRIAEIDSPDLDARLLIGGLLGLDLTGLMIAGHRVLTPAEADGLETLIARRLHGEPTARILGAKEFWGMPLQLSADTLVPRPDTETIVETVLRQIATDGPDRDELAIADLGTGSGAILLALLAELPKATGVATDISPAALTTARNNARHLQLDHRIAFVACDYAAALKGPFDVIVSNPPYIRSADIADLAIDVRAHDPMRALDGGPDGLDAYRAICPQAAQLLRPGGLIVFEVGYDQSDDVGRIMAASGLSALPPVCDLAGISRAVPGRKSAN